MREAVTLYRLELADFERARARFVRLPLSWAELRLFAYFWNPKGGSRGSGTLASVLVAVLLDSWLFKHDFSTDTPSQWTRPAFSSVRRISVLSGCDQESVIAALRLLKEDEFISRWMKHRMGLSRVSKVQVNVEGLRLRTRKAAWFPAEALVGGHLASLPSAARHLLIAVCCTDPVRHESGFRMRVGIQRANVAEVRRRSSKSVRGYCEITGMQKGAFRRAVQILLEPRECYTERGCELRALVRRVDGPKRGLYCLVPDPEALRSSAHDFWAFEERATPRSLQSRLSLTPSVTDAISERYMAHDLRRN